MNSRTLIYRTLGGIGDAMSAIPSIYRYVHTHKNEVIDVAYPKFTHEVFNNIIPVKDSKDIKISNYQKILRLDNPCPCAVYESNHRRNVKYSRIQLFANALGFNPEEFRNIVTMYKMSKQEENVALSFQKSLYGKKVIGIGVHSAESYRNYPKMPQLINELTKTDIDKIYLFGTQRPDGIEENEKLVFIMNHTLREAAIYLSLCKEFITVDSLFLHMAAALNIPTILLDGPLESEFRFASYPIIKRINTKNMYGCMPCWRNANDYCVFSPSDKNESSCMFSIEVNSILKNI